MPHGLHSLHIYRVYRSETYTVRNTATLTALLFFCFLPAADVDLYPTAHTLRLHAFCTATHFTVPLIHHSPSTPLPCAGHGSAQAWCDSLLCIPPTHRMPYAPVWRHFADGELRACPPLAATRLYRAHRCGGAPGCLPSGKPSPPTCRATTYHTASSPPSGNSGRVWFPSGMPAIVEPSNLTIFTYSLLLFPRRANAPLPQRAAATASAEHKHVAGRTGTWRVGGAQHARQRAN